MKNKPVINQWACRFAVAGVSLMGLPLFAQDVENLDEDVTPPTPVDQAAAGQSARLPITVSAGVSEQFNTDIDSGGSFSIARFKTGVVAPWRLNDDYVLRTTFGYGLDSYTFDSRPAPWHNINTLAASAILSWRLDDTWTVYGGAFLKMSAESSVSLSDSCTTGGGIGGFNYKVDDTLSLGAGLAVMSVIEDNARVLPIITAKWKFDDNWLLDVGLMDVATTGYGAKVHWLLDKEFEFGFGAQFHQSRFRISQGNGVGQERATTLFADATWHWCPNVDFNGVFGIAAGGELRRETSNGTQIFETNYKPAPMLGLNASVKF